MRRSPEIIAAALLALTLAPGVCRAGDEPARGVGREDADDTGRNVRDREGALPTAGDQSNDPVDVKVTQEIRRAVVADDSLSTNAHNVKIITNAGVVTLRGPVDSAAEKASIAAKAQQVAGVKRVDDQLEVNQED
jgi:osmotically-inducible protein OsmY